MTRIEFAGGCAEPPSAPEYQAMPSASSSTGTRTSSRRRGLQLCGTWNARRIDWNASEDYAARTLERGTEIRCRVRMREAELRGSAFPTWRLGTRTLVGDRSSDPDA